MNTEYNAGIIGVGSYVPEKVITNKDIEKMVETSEEWIVTRTGIHQRCIANGDIYASDLATQAALNALNDAGKKPEEIDMIIVATITPDMFTPSVACLVQHAIGAKNAIAFDINAACSGFIYGINIANQFIKTGNCKNILVIGAETLSKITDWQDRNTCILFGDGAGAVIVSTVETPYGILSTHVGSDGSLGNVLTAPLLKVTEEEQAKRRVDNARTIWMDGSEVFKFAVKIMEQATRTVVEDIGLTVQDIDVIIPHQANIRIVDGAAKRLKFNKENIFTNLKKYGNMSAASIPVAVDEAVKSGMLKKDDVVVMVGFGGGLTWGSTVMKWKN